MATTHEVTGGAVVLRTKANSAQYLYRGTSFDADVFTEKSVKHALEVGLISKVAKAPAGDDEGAYKGISVADLKADIDKRNEGREDDAKVVPAEPGNRPQIVAALLADDSK